eukprot:scaffold1651_cov317-Pinguiococcus_pyrenoidosus.AAC.27
MHPENMLPLAFAAVLSSFFRLLTSASLPSWYAGSCWTAARSRGDEDSKKEELPWKACVKLN